MKAAIKFFIYMGLIMVVMYSSGCSGNAHNVYGNNEDQDVTAAQVQNDPDNNSMAEAGTGQTPFDASTTTAVNNAAAVAAENTTLVLYFADANGYLQAEQRSVNKTAGIARLAMQELCRGPQSQSLSATVPGGTRLLDINIKDGLCTVNFSQELVDRHSGGSGSESATVYSIVNTLTQFSSVEQVQILVAGRVVESIAGHLDVSVPLTRDSEIIKAGAQTRVN